MIKVGNFLMIFGAVSAILSACDYVGSPVVYGIVFLAGTVMIGIGRKLKRIRRERKAVILRCRLKRKIACSTDQSDHAIY